MKEKNGTAGGENKAASSTPWRKEGVSFSKQLIGLNSTCFFSHSTVLVPLQIKDGYIDLHLCLVYKTHKVCFVMSCGKREMSLNHIFPMLTDPLERSVLWPLPLPFSELKRCSVFVRTFSSTTYSAGQLFFPLHKTNFSSKCLVCLKSLFHILESFQYCISKCNQHRGMTC